ncbi:hypothetical protein NKJ11_32780 [Mesorhizobium sp. M0243]
MSEPIEPIRPQEIVEARRNFAEPIGAAETIARYPASWSLNCAPHSRREGLAHAGSIFCSSASTIASRRSVSGQQCRCVTQSG